MEGIELPDNFYDLLDSLQRVRAGNRDPEHIAKGIAAMIACRNSGACGESDRHEREIMKFMCLLAGDDE